MAGEAEEFPRTFTPGVDDAQDLYWRGATIGEWRSDGTQDLYWFDHEKTAESRRRRVIPSGLAEVVPVETSNQTNLPPGQ